MTTYGNGTEHSPIIISDDESEMPISRMQQGPYSTSVGATSNESNYRPNCQPRTTVTEAFNQLKMVPNMHSVPGGFGSERNAQIDIMPVVLKRKRDESGGGFGDTPKATMGDSAVLNTESKKARKRRRKLEREALERSQPRELEPASKTWPDVSKSSRLSSHSQSLPRPASSTYNSHQRLHPSGTSSLPQHSSRPVPPTLLPSSDVGVSDHSTINTVSVDGTLSWPRQWYPSPFRSVLLSQNVPSSSTPAKSNDGTFPPQLPPSKKNFSIGMKPDPNPHSNHGIFRSAQRPGGHVYVPNPARSLVMEQLPRNKRSRGFLNIWCKNVCGTPPVHLELDNKGKALIEFATAEMARAAFSSPRLQGGHGKGSIRVWWYRVDGVGAGGGVGEIEEGEIQEDDGNVTRPLKKVKNAKVKGKKKHSREAQPVSQAKFPPKVFGHNAQFTFQSPTDIKPSPPFKPATPDSSRFPHFNGLSSVDDHGQPRWPWDKSVKNGFTRLSGLSSVDDHGQPRWPWDKPAKFIPMGFVHPNGLSSVDDDNQPWDKSARLNSNPSAHSNGLSSVDDRNQPWDKSARPNSNHSAHSNGVSSVDDRNQPRWPWNKSTREERCENSHMNYDVTTVPPQSPEHESDDDRSSIASSRPDSPPAETCARAGSEGIDYHSEDMDVESPVRSQHPGGYPDLTVQLHADLDLTASPIVSPHHSPPTPVVNLPAPRPAGSPQELVVSDAVESLNRESSVPTANDTSSKSTPTPPLETLSELRAVMSIPTGPSFTKRSLLVRQKELEEKIARSKLELSQASTKSRADTPQSEAAMTAPVPPTIRDVERDSNRRTVENNLRRLVLDSKRRKAAPLTSGFDAVESDSEATSLSLTGSYGTSNTSLISRDSASPIPSIVFESPILGPNHDSLDDLAVSFITEAIQTVKPPTPQPPPSLLKLELAAKQRKLEQHIAESKLLMTKLDTAQTKQEKEAILRVMRERSRMMDADLKQTPTVTRPTDHYSDPFTAKGPLRVRWPETPHDGCVLIVSDDEDEE